jgi:hypothetical protein
MPAWMSGNRVMISMEPTSSLTMPDRLNLAVTGLEPDAATTLRGAFESMFDQADKWAAQARLIQVTSVEQKREMKLARESRLALREIRCNAESTRKRLKEDSLRRGKAIDGIANVLKALIEPIEEHLQEQETFAERAEAARRDALRGARSDALRALGADPAVYADLGVMGEETWATTLESAHAAHEARLEATRQAEAARVEAERVAAEKREAARLEGIRLEAERAERERLAAEENARLRREAQEREAAAKAERARVEQERREERAKAKAEADAKAEQARAAKAEADRLAAELAAVKAAEEKVAREREAAEAARAAKEAQVRRAAALAPDREKLLALAAAIRALNVPEMATPAGHAAAGKVAQQLAKMAAWVEKTGAEL